MTSFVFVNDATSPANRDGFVHAYKTVFGEPPYWEHYEDEEVLMGVWEPHVRDGIVVLALEDERVVGFGCALPLHKASADIQEFMNSLRDDQKPPIDYASTWYMSELGVLGPYRRRGLGYALVKHRLLMVRDQGHQHYVFRTAVEGSKSLGLYRNLGAVELTARQDISMTQQVQANGSQSASRVFLYGDCNSAINKLTGAA